MTRRNFMYWITSGLFSLAVTFNLSWLDRLAAYGMCTCTPDEKVDYSCVIPKVKPKPGSKPRSNGKPSEWLRSLTSRELRKWLRTLPNIPRVGISGMTPTYHLVNHHWFVASHIAGLSRPELMKLHSAVHYGY